MCLDVCSQWGQNCVHLNNITLNRRIINLKKSKNLGNCGTIMKQEMTTAEQRLRCRLKRQVMKINRNIFT